MAENVFVHIKYLNVFIHEDSGEYVRKGRVEGVEERRKRERGDGVEGN